MPVTLSIKQVPEALAERLRRRAEANHRSMQGELMALLEEALSSEPSTVQEIASRIGALGLETGDEAAAMAREERDAR